MTPESKKTVDDYVAEFSGWQVDVLSALRALVRESAPGATEAFKWAQPVYEQNGPFCYIKVFPRHINFGFWRGAELRAPDGLLQTGGTKMAHIKLTGLADVNRDVFQRLVKGAVELNQTRGDPTNGK